MTVWPLRKRYELNGYYKNFEFYNLIIRILNSKSNGFVFTTIL